MGRPISRKVTADYSEKVNSGNEFTEEPIPSSRAQLGDSGREALKGTTTGALGPSGLAFSLGTTACDLANQLTHLR